MRAAVLREFGAGLDVTQVPDPTPGPGDAIVRTGAAGVCRTDLKVVDGVVPTVPLPIVPGHELAGEVVAVGAGVDAAAIGTRVLVGLDLSCGDCAYCVVGELDHCQRLRRLGMEVDGALGEFVRVPAANLVPLPGDLSYADAATVADAVASPYHAVVGGADVRPGQIVAVYGLGGLGLATVQIARTAGAEVIGIARTPARRELAEELGASWTVDPRDGPVSEQIRDRTDGLGVHAFFDIVGIEGSIDQGVRSCRKGGRVVVLGYMVSEAVAPMLRLVYDEVSVAGSRGSTRADLRAALRLVGDGRVRTVIGDRVQLGEVNAALDRLRAGTTIGRAVVEFPA
ncbi:MAG TPA: zinc-binding dehydrogenase [Egicoccus sp.]|nr:zinc-binding dehydrogenase [Egicoccus sp.]HSK23026.1 zinc-binding dehydrogenase [Egicoccus sp.]